MSAGDIFSEWVSYEKIVANDYMHHREFIALLAEHAGRELEQPLAIVDLGCGDARPVLPLLREFETGRYVGVDNSPAAIDRARRALAGLAIPFEIACGSMPGALADLDGPFDLAIASYSLHHLDRQQKQHALRECRRLLRPGGLLGVVDVFLEEGETREDYICRWQRNARRKFTALTGDEIESLLDHVESCDLPETVADYRRLAEAAGFPTTTPLRQDAERLNRLVVIS
jgi:ubiquinone/menaquinone biosynthesis C-methylase UbiE